MDIEKLEKLSCLHLSEDQKSAIKKSLDGVFEMMSQLEETQINSIHEDIKDATQFREEDSKNIQVKKEERTEGLHIEDGMFLAPKVIKK